MSTKIASSLDFISTKSHNTFNMMAYNNVPVYKATEFDDSYLDDSAAKEDPFRTIVARLPKDPFVIRDVTDIKDAIETVSIIGSVINLENEVVKRGDDTWSTYVIEEYNDDGYLISQEVMSHKIKNTSRVPYEIPYTYEEINTYFRNRCQKTVEKKIITHIREDEVTPDLEVLSTRVDRGVRMSKVAFAIPETYDEILFSHRAPRRPEVVAMAHYLVGLFADLPNKTPEDIDDGVTDFGTGVPAFAQGYHLPLLPQRDYMLIKSLVDDYLAYPVPRRENFLKYIALVGSEMDTVPTSAIFKILRKTPCGKFDVVDVNNNTRMLLDIPFDLQKKWVVRGMTAILGSNVAFYQ